MIILYLLAGASAIAFFAKDKVSEVIQEKSDSWTKFDSLFQKYGRAYGVNWEWLKAICLNESSLGQHPRVVKGLNNPNDIEGSKSEDGKSWGLMQMTIPTARDFDASASAVKLNNAEYSIRLAAQFIKSLKSQFNPNDSRYLEWVIKSYNQGAGNTKKEQKGIISGYAEVYWERFQHNLERVKSNE